MSDRYYWSAGRGRIELEIILDDAESCSHPGDCEMDVTAILCQDYIRDQVNAWDPEDLRLELRGYGAWDDDELSDHERNVMRMVWIAACDVAEDPEQYTME